LLSVKTIVFYAARKLLTLLSRALGIASCNPANDRAIRSPAGDISSMIRELTAFPRENNSPLMIAYDRGFFPLELRPGCSVRT
jgi:hypothetical protein